MKYRVGQRIIYIGHSNCCSMAKEDIGKVATIIDIGGRIGIYIKDSKNNWCMDNDSTITWRVQRGSIKPIPGQMLFEFMYD